MFLVDTCVITFTRRTRGAMISSGGRGFSYMLKEVVVDARQLDLTDREDLAL